MNLKEKFGNTKVITTELGPVKGVFTDTSIENARRCLPLDGINIHDCPMGNLRINAIAMGSLIQQHMGVSRPFPISPAGTGAFWAPRQTCWAPMP